MGTWGCSGASGICQIWSRDMADGSKAVALYNSDDSDHGITLEFWQLGWPWPNSKVSVRDIWEHKDLGVYSESFTPEAKIPAHGVFFGRVTLESTGEINE